MPEPTRWEYLTVTIKDLDLRVSDTLNTYGAKGWELISIDFGSNAAIAFFKRPVWGRLPEKD